MKSLGNKYKAGAGGAVVPSLKRPADGPPVEAKPGKPVKQSPRGKHIPQPEALGDKPPPLQTKKPKTTLATRLQEAGRWKSTYTNIMTESESLVALISKGGEWAGPMATWLLFQVFRLSSRKLKTFRS